MKIASAMPHNTSANGLIHIAKRAIEDPSTPIVVVAVVDVSQVLTDFHKGGQKTATVAVLQIEPILDEDLRRLALRAMEKSYLERTAEQLELPLEFATVVREDRHV